MGSMTEREFLNQCTNGSMWPIELTEVGKKNMERGPDQATKDAKDEIRHRYGYPTWEIVKALYNASGNKDEAMTRLKEQAQLTKEKRKQSVAA